MIKLNFSKSDQFIIYLFALSLLVLSGCVSTSKYQALQTEYDSLQTDRDSLQTDRDSLQTEYDTLNKENNELQEVNRQIQAGVDELQKENIELTNQKESQIEVSQTMIADFKEESQTTIGELQEEIDAKTDQISALEEKLKTNLVEKIIFESGSAKVTREGRRILFRIAPILEEAKDKEIYIVGHCDKLPPGAELSKKYHTNWELSTARAAAVAKILQWGYGIDPDRMYAVGVAHYRPLDMENEKKISEKNRAVEIFFIAPIKAQE